MTLITGRLGVMTVNGMEDDMQVMTAEIQSSSSPEKKAGVSD